MQQQKWVYSKIAFFMHYNLKKKCPTFKWAMDYTVYTYSSDQRNV